MFDEFVGKMQDIKNLRSFIKLNNWDKSTYMPSDAGNDKAFMNKTLSNIIYEKLTEDELYNLTCKLLEDDSLDYKSKFNIKIVYEKIERTKKIPNELFQDISY